MPAWGWILIAIVLVLLVAAVAVAAMRRNRTARLRDQFGPEYDRTVSQRGRAEGETDLAARRERRERLDIRQLDPASRARYLEEWNVVQARFVDDPGGAVGAADELVLRVMRDRGYPMDDFEQRAADASVDHPEVVEHYRAAHAISIAHRDGRASTEDLRQAVVHYRALFSDLLAEPEQRRAEAR
jgi:uncharacterized MAPEG superfamily protein